MVKGLAQWGGKGTVNTHDVTPLITYLRIDERFNNDFINRVLLHVGQNTKQRLLQQFADDNILLVGDNSLNEAFRYPETKKGTSISYNSLRYRHEEVFDDIESIIVDIESMLKEAVRMVNT